MKEMVKQHALLNLWASTYQDYQHHVKLVRFTPPGGVLQSYPVLWDELLVPKNPQHPKAYYHFYQVGQVPPEVIDVIRFEDEWMSLKDLNANNDIHIDVYTELGAVVPKDHVWISFLYNKNLVVAIHNDPEIHMGELKTYYNKMDVGTNLKIENSQFIIRFYSNARHSDPEFIAQMANPNRAYLGWVYAYINSIAKFNSLRNNYNKAIRERPISNKTDETIGTLFFKDGLLSARFPEGYSEAELKDVYLGYSWDDSVILNQDYPLTDLLPFISTKDNGTRKYIVYIDPKKLNGYISYWDDIDLYLINKNTGNGVYYNRVGINAIAMITPNTLSLNADMIEDYIDYIAELDSIQNTVLKVIVRQGGRKIPTFNQKNRMVDLLKLPKDIMLGALVNSTGLVKEWRADSLENSGYMKLMSVNPDKIDSDLIADAYGYNGLSECFFRPIYQLSSNKDKTDITGGFTIKDVNTNLGNRCVWWYEYSDGKAFLKGWNNDTSTGANVTKPDYARNVNDWIAEVFNMQIKNQLNLIGNRDVVDKALEQYGFTCFVGTIDSSGEPRNWEDVTGTTKYYTFTKSGVNGPASIKWNWNLLNSSGLKPMVMIHDTMKVVTKTFRRQDHSFTNLHNSWNNIIITLDEKYTWGDMTKVSPHCVPVGQIEVFEANIEGTNVGHLCLIENVDYVVNYPHILILRKDSYGSNFRKYIVRLFGFPNRETNAAFAPSETGFVRNEVISDDGVHQLRQGENTRLVIDRGLIPYVPSDNHSEMYRHFDELQYGEVDNPGTRRDYFEGKPYEIKDYILPITNLIGENVSYELYKEVKEIDNRIETYLSNAIQMPNRDTTGAAVLRERQIVISPVCLAILKSFSIPNSDTLSSLRENYDNEDIDRWMTNYKWLMKYDPAYLEFDENYFHILPHYHSSPISITQRQYVFLEKVIKIYLKVRVDLTKTVTIRN